MAKGNYQNIPEDSFGNGIDQQSPADKIPQGYVEDLVNVDPTPTGSLSKRVGYQGYAGQVPLRVKTARQSGNALSLNLHEAVSLPSDLDRPIIVYGKGSTGTGEFASNGSHYYTTSSASIRNTLAATGTVDTLTITAGVHGFDTQNLFIEVFESTSLTLLDNRKIEVSEIRVTAAFDVEIDYVNDTGSPFDVYVGISSPDTLYSVTGVNVVAGTDVPIAITGATHLLPNTTIIPYLYRDIAGTYEHVEYDGFTVDTTTKDIIITLDNTTGATLTDVVVLLTDTPLANLATSKPLAASGTTTLNIDISEVGATPFPMVKCMERSGTDRIEILPDSISVDTTTNLLTITFTNNSNVSAVYDVYWDYIDIATNTLQLTGVTSASVTDPSPQLTVYGLCHHELYGTNAGAEAGHVNHIDNYRAEAEARVICGLGGNIFSAKTSSETDLGMGSSLINLIDSTTSPLVIGPAFHDTGAAPGRTRGFITGDNLDSGFAEVQSITYVSSGVVDYVLNIPNLVLTGTAIDSSDQLTVAQCGYERHNGTFDVVSISISGDLLTVQVSNPLVISNRYDEVDVGGLAGVFTDTLVLSGTPPFEVGDVIDSELFNSDEEFTVTAVSGSSVVISGATESKTLPTSLTVVGTRTSNVIPIASVVDFVIGDTLAYSNKADRVHVTAINTTDNKLTVDSSFEFGSDLDSTQGVIVTQRWLPVEAPQDTFTNTPKTVVRHFDANEYDLQDTLRSVMSQDNLYLTNGSDEVMKFDGSDVYRAGLFRWQPQLFQSVDTGASAKINIDDRVGNVLSIVNNIFTMDPGEASGFFVGDIIEHSGDSERYTVIGTKVEDDKIIVNKTITSATSGTVSGITTYKYYFRLNAVDANNNVTASAVTGSDDFLVELSEDAGVQLKLVGMPAWDIYDYDRIDVQVYRTKANGVAPFYLVHTERVSFDLNKPYILIKDGTRDDEITEAQLDPVNSVLKGSELGTTWTQPPRAKYCTSAGNRLVLGNLRGYQKLDVRFLKGVTNTTPATIAVGGNDEWIFRKDSTNTSSAHNMTDVAIYKFKDIADRHAATVAVVDAETITVSAGVGSVEVGDWVYLYNNTLSSHANLDLAGWFQVSGNIVASTSFEIKVDTTSIDFTTPINSLVTDENGKIPVFLGDDANYRMANGNRAAGVDYLFLAVRRLADAINASMRVSGIDPWMIASAGNEFTSGQLVIDVPKDLSTFVEIEAPALDGAFSVFVNNFELTGSSAAGSEIKSFPSRIAISYDNYPEIFDNIGTVVDTQSDSVIDVNPADGQEITAVIPFFGDAAFGSSQKSGVVVVFKTNSIYLVDISAKASGINPVQKLETEGRGCEAPHSVSVTRGGIIFANLSGVYRLNRSLKIDYLGRRFEGIYKNQVVRSNLDRLTGHHDPVENAYKLSYPLSSETSNTQVAVYNHTREYETESNEGSWTKYDNHPVTGWANGPSERFFGSTLGRVFSIRQTGERSDYRDDASAVSSSMLLRALNLGDSGIRKVFRQFVARFKNTSESSTADISTAIDLSTEFESSGSLSITDNSNIQDGLSDAGSKKVIPVSVPIVKNSGNYLQIKMENSVIDEPLELTGLTVRARIRSSSKIKDL